ncbi:carbohydrate porin [Qipengyuania spongiae]|uniref:Carbohydrate porin n=1 Tax=Qipengyuania spongiae TaxID=2909673 RepID=A0ABY5SZ50_9SPHN|nr:carbohydrate porin [Qipengyuania spongiae]UVI39807.1 carbohydrate porin [Qipengyuania spongiae]
MNLRFAITAMIASSFAPNVPLYAQQAPADPGAENVPQPPPTLQDAPPPELVDFKLVAAQFVDSPLTGDAQKDLDYGGKIDAYVDIKGGAVGLDNSLSLHVHPEFRFGQSSNGEIGLLPTNSALFFPASEGERFDLSANLTKRWASGTSLTVGKVNVFDLAAQLPVTGGGGVEGFMNLAFALPPSAVVPNSLVGALLNVPTSKALFRLWVFDPAPASRRSGIPTLFDEGVGALASVTVPTNIGGKPGFYALKVAASTRRGISTRALPPALIPQQGLGFGDNRGEFAVILAGSQYLSGGPRDPAGGIGVFAQAFASAGDPTFLDYSGQAGITGNPPGRPQDRFGLGWFRYSLTDGLVDALARRVPLEDEEGVEAYYTIGLSAHLRLTADLQYIDSAIAPRDGALLGQLRLVTAF